MTFHSLPTDYHVRGYTTKAYPTWEQICAMADMQPSLRAAWNYLVWLRTSHVDALEDYCVQRGLVEPKPSRPEYRGMTSEQSSAAKVAYHNKCKDRLYKIHVVAKDLPDAPKPIYLTAKPGVKSVVSHCVEQGYILASAKGKSHDYQALNFVLRERGLPELPAFIMQRLIKFFNQKSDRPKRHRKHYEVMPIQVGSGPSLEILAERGLHNAKVKMPGVDGPVLCHIHPSAIATLKQPGNHVLEGDDSGGQVRQFQFIPLMVKSLIVTMALKTAVRSESILDWPSYTQTRQVGLCVTLGIRNSRMHVPRFSLY